MVPTHGPKKRPKAKAKAPTRTERIVGVIFGGTEVATTVQDQKQEQLILLPFVHEDSGKAEDRGQRWGGDDDRFIGPSLGVSFYFVNLLEATANN